MKRESSSRIKEIEKYVDEHIDEWLDSGEWPSSAVPNPLLPPEAVRERDKQEMRSFLLAEELRERFNKGMDLILEFLPRVLNLEAIDRIAEEAEAIEGHQDKVQKAMEEGRLPEDLPLTYQEILGISNQTLMDFFKIAMVLMQEGRWEKAEQILFVLNVLAPENEVFWSLKGITYRERGDLEEALKILKLAHELNKKNIEAFGWYLQTCVELGLKDVVDENRAAFEELLAEHEEPKMRWKARMKDW